MRKDDLGVKSFKYLIQILQNNPNIGYIARAITPWHAIGVDSAISNLQEKHNSIQGISLITPHSKTGFCCDETIFTNNSNYKFRINPYNHGLNKIKLFFLFYIFLLSNFLKRKKKDVFIIGSTPDPLLAILAFKYLPNRHIKFLLIDDGAAKYMGTLHPEKPSKGIINHLKYFHFAYMGNVFITNHLDVDSFCFLKKYQDEWIKNDEILPYYRQTLKKLSKNVKIQSIFPQKTFVICTTAWNREQILNNEDLKQLKMVCSILHNHGFNLLLKPHPRDSFFIQHKDDLYCSLLNADSTAMEVICEKYRFQGIISFSSTILVTAKILFNIPTFNISELLNQSNISKFYLNEIDSFKKTFKQSTYFVKNLADFESIVKKSSTSISKQHSKET
ncbi:polysialyltransferase family glycosyltransferase [Fibrobacter sp. UWB7]|uniref:polysialyltransferase family glycosyltransferase n=1 Tax=Fibrobacter sp. UWB7 TaxID=1896206 RepID=UPI00091EFDD4|nr:polysialyltransferase family glycosyltransferase [Fibrobacter sp. UWB7]SHM18157.1 hypothetical protein SAMN05720467_0856 [Fibrobacter sp. UWB7]